LVRDKDHPELLPQVGVPQGGLLNQNEAALHSWLARIAVDYEKSFDQHDVKAFAFAEARHALRTSTPFSGYGIQYDRGNQVYHTPLMFQKLADESESYFSLREQIDRGVTFSLNGTYGFAGKYVVNGVLNYESANTSGQRNGTLWLPTWNIGAKWNVDREEFLRAYPTISKLALRLSYGLTAKMNEAAVNASAVYRNALTPRQHLADRENQLDILHLENRDLTWEKMVEWNAGLELGLWDNRISATLDFYARNSYDLIDLVATSGVGGQYYKYANFGDMRTQGVELGLHTVNVKTSDFKWSTSLTFSAMHQEVTRLLNAPTAFDMVAGRGRGNIVGFPRGSLFSFNYDGLDINGLPTFNFGRYPTNSGEYSHIAGADFSDTQYNKTYLRYHGPIEPQITGGLSNTLSWKQWELSVFFTMQAGNKIRLNPTFDPSFADLNVFSTRYRDRWLNPGDELRTDVPVLPSQALIEQVGRENIERAYNTYNYSQEMVADGSFVRLKNVALAYRLSESVAKKLSLSSAAVRLNVTNPLLIYADPRLHGQDPEYYRSGGVALPTPRQVTLSLSLGF
jgi:putative outer membrane protein probably involved in nutrient binding